MVSDETCPICGFHLISTDAAKCPQCDADLACFAVLDSIPDEMPVVPDTGGPRTEDHPLSARVENPVSEKHFLGKWAFPGAVFLMLAGCLVSGLLIARSNQSGQSSPEVFKCFPMSIKIPVKTPSSYAPFDPLVFDGPGFFSKDAEKKQVESADFKKTSNTMRKGEIYTDYEVGDNETLWRIAKKCYGSGFYFPVLMELNSGLGVYNLEKGARLKVLKDSGRAEHFYHQIVRVAGKRVWYGYRVIKGDNPEGIAVKLYGSEGTVQRIMNDNPKASLQPGERIQVEVK